MIDDSNVNDSPFASVSCPQCGSPLSVGAVSCPACGRQQVEPRRGAEVTEQAATEQRLGIAHLMGFTACIGVGFGILRAFPDPQLENATIYWTFIGGLGTVAGADLFGLLLFMTRFLVRREPFPYFPGEVLLVMYSATTLMSLLPFVLLIPAMHSTTGNSDVDYLPFLSLGVCCIGPLANGVLFVVAAARTPSQRWSLTFACIGIKYFIDFFLTCVMLTASITGLLAAIPLMVAVFLDRQDRLSFPWTHWAGVGLYLGTNVIWLIVTVAVIAASISK